jgi:hypothetical protein
MDRFEQLIDDLKKEQAVHAQRTLRRTEGTQFDFGLTCGLFQGLSRALEIAEGILNQDDKGESTFAKNLKGTRHE